MFKITKPGHYREVEGFKGEIVGYSEDEGVWVGINSDGEPSSWDESGENYTDDQYDFVCQWVDAPGGYIIREDEDYVGKAGDVVSHEGHRNQTLVSGSSPEGWWPWEGEHSWHGMSAKQLDEKYPGRAPHFIASPVVVPAPQPQNRRNVGEGYRELNDDESIQLEDEFSFEYERTETYGNWVVFVGREQDFGETYASAKADYGREYVVRRKVFSASRHGAGIYETRDGEHLELTLCKPGDGWYPDCALVLRTWVDDLEPGCAWYDDGHFDEDGEESPHDLVRYVGPLPKWEARDTFRATIERLWVKGEEEEWRQV